MTPDEKLAERREQRAIERLARLQRWVGLVPDEGTMDCDEPATPLPKRAVLESAQRLMGAEVPDSAQRVLF